MTFPLVTGPEACFYCKAATGQPHGAACVRVQKRVLVTITLSVEMDVPHAWAADSIEFYLNESSICFSNVVDQIVRYRDSLEAKGGCFCGVGGATFGRVVDDTPRLEEPEVAS